MDTEHRLQQLRQDADGTIVRRPVRLEPSYHLDEHGRYIDRDSGLSLAVAAIVAAALVGLVIWANWDVARPSIRALAYHAPHNRPANP